MNNKELHQSIAYLLYLRERKSISTRICIDMILWLIGDHTQLPEKLNNLLHQMLEEDDYRKIMAKAILKGINK